MRRALAALAVMLASSAAGAEPCPMMGLSSRTLRANAEVSAEGGIVVGEVPMPQQSDKPVSPDRSKWKVKVNDKVVEAKQDAIAPGLVVYRPPAGAKSYALYNPEKREATAKLAAKLPDLLEAPRIRDVLSGRTRSKHVSEFVTVELAGPVPKEAIALVLQKAKGAALSWGPTFDGMNAVSVYSTGGGCVSQFPAGTVKAEPGDLVVAFWVDASGRRSRVSTAVPVEKSTGD